MRTRYAPHSKGPQHPYFITSTTVAWIPLFTSKEHFDILADSLSYCRNHMDLKLYAYVILENHIHLIAASPDISKTIQSFKSFTARQLIESITEKKTGWLLHQLGYHKARHKKQSDYQVWQEGFLRSGYVRRPEDWVYSSAGWLLKGERGWWNLTHCPCRGQEAGKLGFLRHKA